MKVLHVISSIDPRTGGPAAALLGLAAAQRSAGINVRAASTYGADFNPDLAEKLKSAGIPVSLIGPVSGPLANHSTLKPTLRSAIADADVVHIHALWESIQHHAARACRAMGRPYVFTPHGMLTPWSLNQSKLKKQIYLLLRLRSDLNNAASLHFTTGIERDLVARLNFRPPTIVEPLGMDIGEFQSLPETNFLRARYPQLAGRRVVIFLGRIHRGKGLELLIPAFAKIKTHDDALVIVGPDSDFARQARSLVAENGLNDCVIFTGLLQGRQRLEALVDADLYALPSYHENFGLAAAEAMACGLPVIVSDQVNLHPDITAAGAGDVTRLNVDALADALKRWLSDQPRRKQAGQRGRTWALQHYDSARIAAHWVEHYQNVIRTG